MFYRLPFLVPDKVQNKEETLLYLKEEKYQSDEFMTK